MFSINVEFAEEGNEMKKTGLVFFVLMISVLIGFAGQSDAASLLIPVAEFTEDGQTGSDGGNYFKLFQGGGYIEAQVGRPCFVAPVRIPGNATKISKVIVYYQDLNPAPSTAWFTLDAINMATGTSDNYVDAYVNTGTDIIQAFELPLSHKTLAKGQVYQLGTCIEAGQYLYGAKVVYTVP